MAKRQGEGLIKEDIMRYLRSIPGVYARIFMIGIIPGRKNHSKGISDILVCFRGKFLAIEVKIPGGKVSPEQRVFLDGVLSSGGTAIVAESLEDVIAAVRGLV